jgi:hypothetical protein
VPGRAVQPTARMTTASSGQRVLMVRVDLNRFSEGARLGQP